MTPEEEADERVAATTAIALFLAHLLDQAKTPARPVWERQLREFLAHLANEDATDVFLAQARETAKLIAPRKLMTDKAGPPQLRVLPGGRGRKPLPHGQSPPE